MPRVAVLIALSSLAGAQVHSQTVTDTRYPADGYGLWESQDGSRVAVARVVDGLTGAPLPSAEVWSLPESDAPIRGEFWGKRIAMADADGFVRIAPSSAAGRLMVRAPGYAANTASNLFAAPIVPLAPAHDLPVRLLDWRHQPVAGALVGFCGGCGHTPDLAHGRTDHQGLVRLAGVSPHNDIADLYVEHPGLDLGYRSVFWCPGLPPARLVVGTAKTITGTLLDASGQPVAGALVGAPEVHRGPWTRTRADGTFALHGAESGSELHVHLGKQKVIFAGGLPPTLRMPSADEQTNVVEAPEVDHGKPLRLRVSIVDAAGNPAPNGRYRAVGPLPARTEWQTTLRDEQPSVEHLPAGRYEVFAASAQHRETRSELVVNHDDQAVTLRPEPLPTTKVSLDHRGEDVTVALRTHFGEFDCTALVRAGTPIGLPDTPFCFVLRNGAHERVSAHEQASALATAPLTLRWFAPTSVRGKLLDASGREVAARLRVQHRRDEQPATTLDARGEFTLPLRDEGLRFLTIEADSGTHQVALLLPDRGDDVQLDLGAIVLGGQAQLTLLAAHGTPHRGALTLLSRGWHDLLDAGPSFPLDAQGAWRGPELRAGDALLLPGAGADDGQPAGTYALAVRFLVTDPRPQTRRLPSGELHLRVTSEAGAKLPCGITIGDSFVTCDGEIKLRRVPPGRHRLWIAAHKHRAVQLDIDVAERAEVQVVLPPQ